MKYLKWLNMIPLIMFFIVDKLRGTLISRYLLIIIVVLAIHKRVGRIILGVIVAIAGVLWIAVTLYTTKPHSYTIIGGADGPTSIFLAGKYGAGTIITAVIGGLVLAVSGILLIAKKGKNNDQTSQ